MAQLIKRLIIYYVYNMMSMMLVIKIEDDINVFVSTVFGNTMISVITVNELATCVDNDKTLCKVRQCVNGERPDKRLPDEKIRPYFMVRDELSVYGSGCIARRCRAVIPEVLRTKVLSLAHEGHPDI